MKFVVLAVLATCLVLTKGEADVGVDSKEQNLKDLEELVKVLNDKAEEIAKAIEKKINENDPVKRAEEKVASITDVPEECKYCSKRERCKIDAILNDLKNSLRRCLEKASLRVRILAQEIINLSRKIAKDIIDLEREFKECEHIANPIIRRSCYVKRITEACGLIKKTRKEVEIMIRHADATLRDILKELVRCSERADRMAELELNNVGLSIDACIRLHYP